MIKDWLQWYSLSVNIWMCQEVIYQTYDRKINKSKCAKNEGLSRIPIDFVMVRKEWRKTIMSCLNTSKKEMKLEERFEKAWENEYEKVYILYWGFVWHCYQGCPWHFTNWWDGLWKAGVDYQ